MLTTAVFAIVLTAPLGAIMINTLGTKLLSYDGNDPELLAFHGLPPRDTGDSESIKSGKEGAKDTEMGATLPPNRPAAGLENVSSLMDEAQMEEEGPADG